jgi:hypothetical protein
MRLFVTAIALVLSMSACGGTDGASSTDRTQPTNRSDPTPGLAPRCTDVGVEVLAQIQVLPHGDGIIQISRGATYESPTHPDQVFLAAELSGDGVAAGTIGVWSTASLEPQGGTLFLAVDEFAQKFTGWPEAEMMAGHVAKDDPVVDEARSCLKG